MKLRKVGFIKLKRKDENLHTFGSMKVLTLDHSVWLARQTFYVDNRILSCQDSNTHNCEYTHRYRCSKCHKEFIEALMSLTVPLIITVIQKSITRNIRNVISWKKPWYVVLLFENFEFNLFLNKYLENRNTYNISSNVY